MNILFITATRIGDAVLSTGLLAYLAERYPDARITIAAGIEAAPLFQGAPRVIRTIVVRKRAASLHWLSLYARVAGHRWDLVVDLRGSALAWTLRARERKVIDKADPTLHQVRQLGRLFNLDPPPGPRLWLGPGPLTRAASLLPLDRRPFVSIGPAANWRGKQWRAEHFPRLAQRLTASDGLFPEARVAVLAAEHERPQAEPLLAALPPDRVINLVGKTGLLTAAAIISWSQMFIGNDTGLMHIAAAVDAPTLGLFGPSPIARYAPWGRRTAVVRTEDPPESMFGLGFNHLTTDTLMDSLSVDAVEAAARQLWRRAASEAA
jgi:heptosyltransferase-3